MNRNPSRIAFLACLALLMSGAVHGESQTLQLKPGSATVLVQRQIQFSVKGSATSALHWYVNDVPGGDSSVGLVSESGLYTAPASVPPGGKVAIKAALSNSTRIATASLEIAYETQTGAPLRRSKENPRYFENSAGAILLAGSHTWNDVVDMGLTDPPAAMDYSAYIEFLKSKNHNFTRLWTWELPKFSCGDSDWRWWPLEKPTPPVVRYAHPFPWLRSGPGTASDGKPKFDLSKFDSAYFERLRARVAEAQANGIFVGVMLFTGPGCERDDDGFPFHSENNVNGINAARGKAIWTRPGSLRNPRDFPFFVRHFCRPEWVTGTNPAVVAAQQAYVAKVLDTLNSFDNVLWEISNEAGALSTKWQEDMIRFVRDHEAKLPKQHPVGFTYQWGPVPACNGTTQTLLNSDADWISPGNDAGDYRGLENGPAANDGKKVIISDTDHLWGIGGTPLWVWKSFLRGMNVLYMDVPFDDNGSQLKSKTDDAVRLAMADVLGLARRLPLARLAPSTTLCSTGFAMADAGKEYLCLAPQAGAFTLDLSSGGGTEFSVEWFDIAARKNTSAKAPIRGGQIQNFSCPSEEHPCVVHLKKISAR